MDIETEHQQFVEKFRDATPFINGFRHKVFVIYFSESLFPKHQFTSFIRDLSLLHSLGIKLILIHGSRHIIDQEFSEKNIESNFINDLRITKQNQIFDIKKICGNIRFDIEAKFSSISNRNSLFPINIVSGNFITAQPVGIIDGTNHLHTGKVRKINSEKIHVMLSQENIVLLSPIGISPSGELFNLNAADLATECAIRVKADKLIFMTHNQGLYDENNHSIEEITNHELKRRIQDISLRNNQISPTQNQQRLDISEPIQIQRIITAADRGVNKVQLIDHEIDGALILELFTNQGIGTLISRDLLEDIYTARADDINGIIQLISPLEKKGYIVKRSRESLEVDINNFYVIKRENQIIACGALFYDKETNSAELACLAVEQSYQHSGRASKLFTYICEQAKKKNIESIYVLTTQTSHWFQERGFIKGDTDQLPLDKQKIINSDRKSEAYFYFLNESEK